MPRRALFDAVRAGLMSQAPLQRPSCKWLQGYLAHKMYAVRGSCGGLMSEVPLVQASDSTQVAVEVQGRLEAADGMQVPGLVDLQRCASC